MAIDFKNIVLKFVRIVSGVSSIDAAMTEAKFNSSKPSGYFKAFIFPKADFAGVDYEDLYSLVGGEISDVWDKTNRNTLLGYNEESNTFICNITAYMGLKDPDLKIAGEIEHPNQAAWYEMELTTTKAGSIITLQQTDGSDIYLKIKDPVFDSPVRYASSGSACLEYSKKDINDDANPFIKKYQSLWAKGDKDVLLMRNNLPKAGKVGSFNSVEYSYVKSGKITKMQGSRVITLAQSCMYGIKKVHFLDSTASTQGTYLTPFSGAYVKNLTGKDVVKYSDTNDFKSMIQTGDYIVMQAVLKRTFSIGGFSKNSGSTTEYPNGAAHSYSLGENPFGCAQYALYTYSKPTVEGVDCDLMSCSPNEKPKIYKAAEREIVLTGSMNIDAAKCFNNLPDSTIACGLFKQSGTNYIIRFKKGDTVKRKAFTPVVAHGIETYVKLGNAGTGFGVDELKDQGLEVDSIALEAGTGFTDIPTDNTIYGAMNSSALPLFTIYHTY